MSPAAGSRIGPYEITALLGAGGMGQVWQAHDTRLQRDVALKVLPGDTLGDATARARLVREARLASKLNHPHICTIYEVGESGGQAFIAMELVEGQPLWRISSSCPHRASASECRATCCGMFEAPDFDQPRMFMTARQAVEVAYACEVKAYDYFDAALAHVNDPAVRTLFAELRSEEAEHQAMVKAVMAKLPPESAETEAFEPDEPVGQ